MHELIIGLYRYYEEMQIPKSKPILLYSLTKFPDDSMYCFSQLQSIGFMQYINDFLEGNNDSLINMWSLIFLKHKHLLKPFLIEEEKS